MTNDDSCMTNEQDKEEVRLMIEGLFRLAGVPLIWRGEINDQVAEVFGTMLSETRSCSDAFRAVPTPPLGKASIMWLVGQFGHGLFRHYSARLSSACARAVAYRWRTPLELASMGFARKPAPQWG